MRRVLKKGGFIFVRDHDVPEGDIKLIKYLNEKHQQYEECPIDEIHYTENSDLD